MKTLKNFLSPKAKWHPKKGLPDLEGREDIKEEIANFFEDNRFEKIEANNLQDFYNKIYHASKPAYWMKNSTNGENNGWIRFGKGGKNSVFFWRFIPLPERFSGPSYQVYPRTSGSQVINFETFDEFKDYVDKYFGWC